MPLNSGDILSHADNTEENARLEVSCGSFCWPLQKSFFDVRVTHLNCPSHVNKPQKSILKQNEAINKTGTSQVGAIFKAQKAQNIFLEKNLKFSKIFFLSENVAQSQKCKRGDPF